MWENPSVNEHLQFAQLVRDWRDERVPEKRQQGLFITVMKNHAHLDHLANLLTTQQLQGINAIVIDDEADQAGPNTRPLAPEASTTHRRIRRIKDCLPKHTYLQYTATAQALFLIALLDMLSPDYADVLESGEEYCGGRAFFIDRPDLIKTIPDSERPDHVIDTPEPPSSLLDALRLFFLGVAVELKQSTDAYRSMLIHPHYRTAIHRSYRTWTDQVQRRWSEVLRRPETDEERQELAELGLIRAYRVRAAVRFKLKPADVFRRGGLQVVGHIEAVCILPHSI